MLQIGVIKESDPNERSQFVNCLLVTRRKNKKLRILLDSRLVNIHSRTIQATFSTNIEILASIPSNVKYISVLDLANAFYSIPVEKKSQNYFSFFDHKKRRLQFTVLPQGFKNSPYFLQKVLSTILSDLKGVLYFADDIVIYSTESMEDNIETVIHVLKRLANEGLKIAPQKLKLAQISGFILKVMK